MERNVLISISALANTPRDGSWRRDTRALGADRSPSPASTLRAPPDQAAPQAGHLCAAGGCHCWVHLPPPGWAARPRPPARPRRFKYADRRRRVGGGRGRKGEEGGRERSGERRGEPQPGAQGTRCEVVRFPPPTPLPAAAPTPATPPPSAACPPGACCFLLKGRNCATLGERGALIYIFLSSARLSRNNLALSIPDPRSASASLEKTHANPLPGAHPGQGLGARSGLFALSPPLFSCLSFSFLRLPSVFSHLSLLSSLLPLPSLVSLAFLGLLAGLVCRASDS